MNKVFILFIYADECPDCNRAKLEVQKAITESNKPCELKLFKFDTNSAINIAINNDIDDIPACIVGNKDHVFQADDITREKVLKAISLMAS